jgi:protein-disulfide isomerase
MVVEAGVTLGSIAAWSAPLKITRRELALGAGALAVAGAGFAAWTTFRSRDILGDTANAGPAPSLASNDLMQPGPLGDMVLGDPKAPVTIIEYASMTCPHCAHFSEATFPELKKRYIDTGKVRFIFREFPLDQLAAAGFMVARCSAQSAGAAADGTPSADASRRYFGMVETLFAQQRDWVVEKPLQPLLTIAKQAGFTEQSLNECLKNQKILDAIEEVRERAVKKFNVQSTPTFFINGKKYAGAMEIGELDKLISPYLKS